MRYGIILISFLLVSCVGEAEIPDTKKEVATEQAAPASATEAEDSEEPLKVDSTIEAIRAVYQETEAWKASGQLQKDTLAFACYEGEMDGEVILYVQAGEIVLVEYGLYQGDHGGSGESWYFREGEPVFVFVESSYWQFAGPEREAADGSMIQGTKDVVTEERYYVYEQKVIRSLTKDYEILSWADEPTNPDNVPNQLMEPDGELPNSWELIHDVIKTRRVDCTLVE